MYITAGICHKLAVALETSGNIDYCDGLLGGLAAKDKTVFSGSRTVQQGSGITLEGYITYHLPKKTYTGFQEGLNYMIIVTEP